MWNLHPLLFSTAAPLIFITSRGPFSSFVAAMSTTNQQCTSSKSAIIFLHGLGDTPAGWSSLQRNLPKLRPKLGIDVHYVFPRAPTISLSINGGMSMPGWFDLYDWPIGVGSKDDEVGMTQAVAIVEQTVEKLESEEGILPSSIILGGFSQGGAVALLTAYHHRIQGKIPFAGCVCLSGWLTLLDKLVVTEQVAQATPLFWGHGRYDDKVLFEQQAFGVEKLKSHGVQVTSKEYQIGHESNQKEMEAMAEFCERHLCHNELCDSPTI